MARSNRAAAIKEQLRGASALSADDVDVVEEEEDVGDAGGGSLLSRAGDRKGKKDFLEQQAADARAKATAEQEEMVKKAASAAFRARIFNFVMGVIGIIGIIGVVGGGYYWWQWESTREERRLEALKQSDPEAYAREIETPEQRAARLAAERLERMYAAVTEAVTAELGLGADATLTFDPVEKIETRPAIDNSTAVSASVTVRTGSDAEARRRAFTVVVRERGGRWEAVSARVDP